MTPDLVWYAAILLVLGLFAALMRWLEFDPTFASRVAGMNPSDLKDPILSDTLRDVITHRQVAFSRLCYIGVSILLLMVFSGTLVCTDFLRDWVKRLLPPFLTSIVKKPEEGERLRFIFWYTLYFAGLFHLLPVMSIMGLREKQTTGQGRKEDWVGRVLTSFLIFQRWFLNRVVSHLLRYRPNPDEVLEVEEDGGMQWVIKSKVADLVCKRGSPETINEEYGRLSARTEGLPLGSGMAASVGSDPPTPTMHQKVIRLIKRHGIHSVRKGFITNPLRVGRRRLVALEVTCRVNDTDVSNAVMKNVGDGGKRGAWSSFLLWVPRPSDNVGGRIEKNALMRIRSVGGQPFSEAVRCLIMRVEPKVADHGIWLGAVVQNNEVERFSKAINGLCATHRRWFGWFTRPRESEGVAA